MKGRKATLKAIDGGLTGVPKMPSHLPSGFRSEWNAIAADMVSRKILTTPALGVLETYIVARWTVLEAQKSIATDGVLVKSAHGNPKPNPANGLLTKALEAVARLSAELGITPAAQSKKSFQKGVEDGRKGAPAGMDF